MFNDFRFRAGFAADTWSVSSFGCLSVQCARAKHNKKDHSNRTKQAKRQQHNQAMLQMVTPRKAHRLPQHRSPRRSPKFLDESSWKETLLESCLQRARKRRAEAASRRRQELIARMLVEEELEESGVGVLPLSQSSEEGEGADDMDTGGEEYAISEEELYELMQEVEEKLQREELDAAEYEEQLHMEELEHRIAEYEEWESEMQVAQENSIVVCPLCQEMELVQQTNAFVCPNYAQGSCSFSIDRKSQQVTLSSLLQNLQGALVKHSDSCACNLEFTLETTGTTQQQARLIGECSGCCWREVVL